MQLDGFLQLIGPDNQPLGGETLDRSFKGRAIAIEEFSMGDSTSDDDEKKKHQAAQGQQTGTGQTPSTTATKPLLDAVKADAHGQQAAQVKTEEKLCFSVSKDMDVASPALFQAYCRMKAWREPNSEKDKTLGQFPAATVTLRKFFGPMAFAFLVFKFTQVRIISYSVSVGDDAVPKEKLQFKFSTYTVEYTAQESTGARGETKTSNWDIGNNAPV